MVNAKDWVVKFANAFRGVKQGVLGQSSFLVHVPMALATLALAYWLQCNHIEYLVLVLCITIVLAAELMNSSIERLAKAITQEHNEQVGAALDIASASVLVASVGAAIVGGALFLMKILEWPVWSHSA